MIRKRTVADLAACVAALRATHGADGYPERWPADPAGWLAPPGMLGAWVAVAGDAVLGHVLIRAGEATKGGGRIAAAAGLAVERTAMVGRLLVVPGARGAGLGGALLGVAVAAARERGLAPVLDVASGAAAAIALYDREGWRRVGTAVEEITDGTRLSLELFVGPDH
ncbi:MAG: GNAT family N-acetyltransferase [Frankiaceae bacterium]